MPGVTTRKRLVNRASRGLCTLFSVCQATSIAITTVLPAPVAIFRATRGRPELCWELCSASRGRQSVKPSRPATSARKIAVSAASRWQNRTRSSRVGSAQCSSSLRVVGVTLPYPRWRHRPTSRRRSLIREFFSRRSPVRSMSISTCVAADACLPFLIGAMGMNDSLGRRPGLTAPVGPFGPISKCWSGCSYGELMIGFSIDSPTVKPPSRRALAILTPVPSVRPGSRRPGRARRARRSPSPG